MDCGLNGIKERTSECYRGSNEEMYPSWQNLVEEVAFELEG